MRSMTSSPTPLRRAAATCAAQTYAASRSRTALRMAIERSFASTTLSSRKKVTRGSIRSASFGLWRSMLNGPRTPPNTFTTASTTAWFSAGTSDLPATGVMRGMMSSFLDGQVLRVRPSMHRGSADLHAVFLQRVVPQLEPEPRRLGQRHESVDDGRALAKQLEPQRITGRVREAFQDEPGRARRDRMHMDLRIVMRGERDLVQLGHHGRLAPGRQPAGPGRVDDQIVDQPLRHHRTQAERAVLGLSGGERDIDLGLQPLQRVAFVVPGHRVLEPEDVVRSAERRRAD